MDYYSEMLARYKSKGLLVDSNLLLLLLVGLLDPNRIERFKRTQAFDVDAFELLKRIVELFATVVTTPNVLTEVSNLLGQLPEAAREDSSRLLAELAGRTDEQYRPSRDLVGRHHFAKFGLTDSSVIESCRGRYLVLTVDLPLFHYLINTGVDAINFNHLRSAAWFLSSSS